MAGSNDSRSRVPPNHPSLHGLSSLESGGTRTARRPDRSRRHRVQDRGLRRKRRRLRAAGYGRGRGAACLGFANRTLGTLVGWDEQRNSNGDASSRWYPNMECSGGRSHVSAFGQNSGRSSVCVDRVAFGVGPDGGGPNRRKSRGCSKEPRMDARARPDPRSDATRTIQDVADQGLDRCDQIQRRGHSRFIEGGAPTANAYVHRCRQRVVCIST
ncbi:hypothetical protein IMCC21224_1529 [Puniceibacterium sp. IMCC21224]|nr:hypothetical protein IMCC21224_1529 [Puniceibacterium sp. IMCC21224]